MGRRIDTQRQAADDAQAGLGQRPGKVFSGFDPGRRGIATANNGQARLVQKSGVAAHVEQAGGIGNFQQACRVIGVGEGQDVLARLIGPGLGRINSLCCIGIE